MKMTLKLNEVDGMINDEPIKAVIGQDEAKKKLSFFVKSHSKETPFPTLLLTGSQGLGKTYLAEKVAKSLGRELIEINCSGIETAEDFLQKVWVDQVFAGGDSPRTILLDEAHKLSFEVTTLLLSMLNPNASNKNNIIFNADFDIEYNFYTCNIIFATTEAHMMFKPLLNRCTEVYLSRYNENDLFKILQMYLPNIRLTCSKKELADACRGRARDAFQLSQNIKRFCSMYEVSIMPQVYWNELKGLFGIHDMGLNSQEINFLKILSQYTSISSKNLAMKMGINVNNIEEELEVRPRELGFIESTSKGRALTEDGRKYLNKMNPKGIKASGKVGQEKNKNTEETYA